MLGLLMVTTLLAAQEPAAPSISGSPRLRNAEAIITPDDYPVKALQRHEYGISSIVMRVSADGKVTTCDVTESSSSAALDLATCTLYKRRAKFDPAKNDVGVPVAGEYRLATNWGLDDHQPQTTIESFLQVPVIPADYQSPVKARLLFNEAGRVTACEVMESSGSIAADHAACSYTKQQLVIAAPRKASNTIPLVAIRYLTATLLTQGTQQSAKR